MSSRRSTFARQGAAILCAVTLGTLLFSARVAPMLFDALPEDRTLAGRIAGRAFESAYWIAFGVALVALAVACFARSTRARIEIVLSVLMLFTAALQLFWIAPAIARHGAGWPWSFASLHGAGGAMHLMLAVAALVLSWLLLASAPRYRS
ncbi:MAG: DUF4149 domain-containing protein [Gemmatimonadota bacterium]|nr:DUF4149 domain-containing protein [Gemmatimonadota bacterium]